MAAPLDMSLDDLIKNNRKSRSGNSRGRGRASGPGPVRRLPNRAANRTPYSAPKAAEESTWQHDMFVDQRVEFPAQVGRSPAIQTGTKLYISNLDYSVSNEDIKELFSEVGDMKRYGIHYDKSGRSKGTAEVIFARRLDGVAAVKKYNNVQLDGKPMKIEIVGSNMGTPAVGGPAAAVNPFENFNGPPRRMQRRGGPPSRQRGGRGFSRGRGRGRGPSEKVSAEDLDADLEKYHAESMQIN